jgi:hypothetical protein
MAFGGRRRPREPGRAILGHSWHLPIVEPCVTTAETSLATPEALMRCFADRLNAGDLDGLDELDEPSAVFEPQPGVVIHGHTAIRHALGDCPRPARQSAPRPSKSWPPTTSRSS